MSISTLDIIVSFIITIVVFFYILKKGTSYRTSKNIWKMYSEIAEGSDLEIKDSLRLVSTWPNLFGNIGGKRAYIHPDKGKGKKKPPKTVYAVESNVDIEDDVIITTSESNAPEESYTLDVPSLNNYQYEVYSMSKLDEEKMDDIFSKGVSRKINDLIENNEEDFRGLILEPGLAMFSTFNVSIEGENSIDNLEKLSSIVEDIEENAADLNENLISKRLSQISQGTKSTAIKSAVMVLLIGLGGFLMYITYMNFSLIFLNIALAALVIGLLNIYSTISTVWKYQ